MAASMSFGVSSAGEMFPFVAAAAEVSTLSEGWVLRDVLISALGGGGFPLRRTDLVVVDRLRTEPFAEPPADEVFGVRGVELVEVAADVEFEFPIPSAVCRI